jgi:protein-tyrosine-phosphatase
VENACRSQMAEAFANIYGKGMINAFSSGSRPSGVVNPRAIAMMKEVGYDMSRHTSKSFNGIPHGDYDYVIMMGCNDECPFVPARHWEDWNIPDPKDLPDETFRQVRDLTRDRVINLIERISTSSNNIS